MQQQNQHQIQVELIKQALVSCQNYKKNSIDRLRPGQTKIVLEGGLGGEVTYKTRPKDPNNSRPFKPLQPMTVKMLADAVNHAKLKRQIIEEIKSEKSQEKKQEWQMSSSEDLYSNSGDAAYELPQINPDQLKIALNSDNDEEEKKD